MTNKPISWTQLNNGVDNPAFGLFALQIKLKTLIDDLIQLLQSFALPTVIAWTNLADNPHSDFDHKICRRVLA